MLLKIVTMQIYCFLTCLLVIFLHRYVFCLQWRMIWRHWQQTTICCLYMARLRPLCGGNIPAAIAMAANIAMLFMFGLSQKVKWFSAQQMLSPRGIKLSLPC